LLHLAVSDYHVLIPITAVAADFLHN